ncbi:fumarate hydratase [Candidatus Omnitrophota bacterium]
MRKISVKTITDVVAELAIKANISLRKDVLRALKKALRSEKNLRAKKVLQILIDNATTAEKTGVAICQDTGMAVVFCDIGNEVEVAGDIGKAINEGIKLGYKKGFLRKSVVSDPLIRKNTNTNTPCIVHYNMSMGKKLKLTVLPKGFGSENASRVVMLGPTEGEEAIVDLVVNTVKESGADACPPLVVGVGIGGTLDKAAEIAKKATLRPIDKSNPKKHLAALEKKILLKLNKTGIGPAGLGGKTTCLGVNIESFPTHIAGLPVCVNISCHAMRSASKTLGTVPTKKNYSA